MATAADVAVKFHLSLNVSDLDRSIGFYRTLFGVEPAKARHDYAKFELDEPPVVLSLIPSPTAPGGALNHVGIRMADSRALVAAQARLEGAGYPTQREEGVECCYARQTKFWITDPDRTLWELYVLHEDIDHRGSGSVPVDLARPKAAAATAMHAGADTSLTLKIEPAASASPARATWLHMLTQPLPDRVPYGDGSLDEVQLEGTFNMQLEAARLRAFLRDALRALSPGGSVVMHGLTSDRPLAARPDLPGPAAFVEHVMTEVEAARALADAGFAELEFTTLGAAPCFVADGVEMRETRIVARKPLAAGSASTHQVLYRGPLALVADDAGNTFRRGQRVEIGQAAYDALRAGPLAEHFVFFACGVKPAGCAH